MAELANIQIKVFLQLSESLINAPVKKNSGNHFMVQT